MTTLNIVFAGTPEFALPCLRALEESRHNLLAVYTQPDRPAGRGRKVQTSAVKTWALEQGIPVAQPLNFKDELAVEALAALNPDVLVVIAYGLILPQKVLNIPKFGCINVHASLLPRWRGASPIQQALLHGDPQSGVTIMQMDAGMDTGDVLCEVVCPIDSGETAGTLHDKLAGIATAPLLTIIEGLAADVVHRKPQDNRFATPAPKINKEDAAINWHEPADKIDRVIRAFNPWPIAFTHLGEDVLRIHQASVEPVSSSLPPGTVLAIDKTGMRVATGHHILRLERIQFSGGKVITIADWLNSGRSQLFINQVFQ